MRVAAVCGSYHTPSKTRVLVETILDEVHRQLQPSQVEWIDFAESGAHIGAALSPSALDGEGRRCVEALLGADLIVFGSPIYKGAVPGVCKHLFDLLDQKALRGKVVLPAANGGSYHHSLVVEYSFRPLFAFFQARMPSVSLYCNSETDFTGQELTGEGLLVAIREAVRECGQLLSASQHSPASDPGR